MIGGGVTVSSDAGLIRPTTAYAILLMRRGSSEAPHYLLAVLLSDLELPPAAPAARLRSSLAQICYPARLPRVRARAEVRWMDEVSTEKCTGSQIDWDRARRGVGKVSVGLTALVMRLGRSPEGGGKYWFAAFST